MGLELGMKRMKKRKEQKPISRYVDGSPRKRRIEDDIPKKWSPRDIFLDEEDAIPEP